MDHSLPPALCMYVSPPLAVPTPHHGQEWGINYPVLDQSSTYIAKRAIARVVVVVLNVV